MSSRISLNSLRCVFRKASALHLIIDVQDLYCDPTHPFAADNGLDFTWNEQAADRIAPFVDKSRSLLTPFWVAQGITYDGSQGHNIEYAGLDDPRRFCETHLYHQNMSGTDFVCLKKRYDAFDGTELAATLGRFKTVDTLFMSGVTIEDCVSLTASSAARLGYHVILIEDLIGHGERYAGRAALINRYIDNRGWGRARAADILSAIKSIQAEPGDCPIAPPRFSPSP